MKKSKGFSLITTVMVLLVMLVIGGAAAFITYYSMQATRSYAKFTVASQAASSGLYQAISQTINQNKCLSYYNVNPFTLNNLSVTPAVYGFADNLSSNCMIISVANYNGANVYRTTIVPLKVVTGAAWGVGPNSNLTLNGNSIITGCDPSNTCNTTGLAYNPNGSSILINPSMPLPVQNNCNTSANNQNSFNNKFFGQPPTQQINYNDFTSSITNFSNFSALQNAITNYINNILSSKNSQNPPTIPTAPTNIPSSCKYSGGSSCNLQGNQIICGSGSTAVTINLSSCPNVDLGSSTLNILPGSNITGLNSTPSIWAGNVQTYDPNGYGSISNDTFNVGNANFYISNNFNILNGNASSSSVNFGSGTIMANNIVYNPNGNSNAVSFGSTSTIVALNQFNFFGNGNSQNLNFGNNTILYSPTVSLNENGQQNNVSFGNNSYIIATGTNSGQGLQILQNGSSSVFNFGQNGFIYAGNANILENGGSDSTEFNNSLVYINQLGSQGITLNGSNYMDGGFFYINNAGYNGITLNGSDGNNIPSVFIVNNSSNANLIMNGNDNLNMIALFNNLNNLILNGNPTINGSVLLNKLQNGNLNGNALIQWNSQIYQTLLSNFGYLSFLKSLQCGVNSNTYNQLILTAQTLY